jgi:hypothetical protein
MYSSAAKVYIGKRQAYKIKTKIVKLQTMSGQMVILFEPDYLVGGTC